MTTITEDDELSYLMDLADAIGERIARGDLPPQDENGFYIYSAVV